MRLLDISAELGRGASPATLEALVRGVRVAVDVARDADVRRVRRGVTEQMKFPTDSELRAAVERFAPGDEQSPGYRAERQIEARERLRDVLMGAPPEIWFDLLIRQWRRPFDFDYPFREAGFERLFSTGVLPAFSSGIGLDVLDPILYQALVSEALARLMPGDVGVRELRYENPFFKRLFGKGTAEQTISTTAQVIETVNTLGAIRKMAKADAEVAERTVDHRVEDSELDVRLRRLRVHREREALIADRIANARAAEELSSERRQRAIIEAAMRQGKFDIADAVRELGPSDAAALGELGFRRVELEEHYEHDETGENP